MKTNCLTQLLVAAFSFATCATVACAQKEKVAAPAQAAAPAEAATAKWSDIKELNYDARGQFFTGLKLLENTVDVQMKELTAKRAAMKSTRDTKEWDFAMKEMSDARSYLAGMGEEAGHATVETWDQQKEKVGQAWTRTQAAYDKVKGSTTG